MQTPGDSPVIPSSRGTHFARAALIGLCAGLVAVAFRRVLALVEEGREETLKALYAYPAWGWAVLPAAGLIVGGLVGYATQRWAPDASGSGIPHLKGVLLHLRTFNWKRLLPVKFFGGALGIGAGLSLGREGPTVQMGAGIAQVIARLLRAPASDIPQLLSAGGGAGLAAAFNAPLAGLLFVVEELHRELSSRTATGALVAAVCATVITQALAGDTPSFEVHDLTALPLWALPFSAIVGVLGGLGGVAFNQALLRVQAAAIKQAYVPRWTLAAFAAALAGLVAWWLPDAVGGGHSMAERLLAHGAQFTIAFTLALLIAKFGLTVVSYGSAAPGGIFAPMLLLGALLGTAFAQSIGQFSAEWAVPPATLAVLGMAAFFVGSVRAPLTGIVLISEMTGGYDLLFPICIAALLSYLTAEALRDAPIYDALLEADLKRSGHGHARAAPRLVYIGVQTSSAMANVPIAKAGLPRGCLVISVERSGATMLPTADMVLQPGDHVSILTPGDDTKAALEIVRLCTGL